MTQKTTHYVDNARLYDEFKAFYQLCTERKEQGLERPPVPRYIAECILKITTNLSRRPNFINYSFKDDMISEANLACFNACYYFNPNKTNNPFAYMTQSAFNAFILVIKKEKKQTQIKANYIFESVTDDFLTQQDHDNQEFNDTFIEFLRENSAFVEDFQRKKEKKVKKPEVDITELLEGTETDE